MRATYHLSKDINLAKNLHSGSKLTYLKVGMTSKITKFTISVPIRVVSVDQLTLFE